MITLNAHRFAVAIGSAAIAAALLGGTASSAGAAATVETPTVVAAPIARYDVRDIGHAPASTPVSVAVTLAYRNAAELNSLVELQAEPGSPLFRHYLTPAQFASAFAPSPAEYERVALSLRRAGFRIAEQYANRTVIDAVAGAAVAERYFGTRIDLVAQTGRGIRYANVATATLPASIAASVSSVLGLDNVVKIKSDRVRAIGNVPAVADVLAAPSLSGPIERTSGGQFAGLYPTGIAKAYKYPAQSGFTGTGHALAVVIDSDILNSDLTTFWKAAGITRTGKFYRVLVNGSNPGVNADVGETAIDTETTSSLAPGADIYLYLISSLSDAPIEDAYNLAVSHDIVDVTSSSFGGCELDDIPFAQATDKIALQGAALGITFTASTGDSGSDCEDATAQGAIYYEPYIVNNPASNPHFVGVGGTQLAVNASTGARVSETAWGPGGALGGGGGGVSSYWPIPTYQNGVRGMAVVPKATVAPPATPPKSGFAGRNLPDISLDASNASGSYVAVYDTPDGGWTGYGGTSVSNPLFAALVVEQNQKLKSRAGFLQPALYATFTNSGKSPAGIYGGDFLDITRGSIGGFSAKTGYDQATGIGAILNGAF